MRPERDEIIVTSFNAEQVALFPAQFTEAHFTQHYTDQPALSLPEILILRRVLKPRLIATFVGIVGVAIVLTGYLFNLVIG